MAKIKDFLNKYDTILFDMDGVITSEQAYWTCAALVVYEMLTSREFFGDGKAYDTDMYNKRKQIRDEVFCGDKTISTLKNKGVNSNWDLAYVVLAEALLCEKYDFDDVYERVCKYDNDVFLHYDILAQKLSKKFGKTKEYYARLGPFWDEVCAVFQKIYLGEADAPPLMGDEMPIFSVEQTKKVLSALKENGKSLGTGTGRPLCELKSPFERWGLTQFFDKERLITYDEVVNAEEQMAREGVLLGLTKPHPFMFLKGALKKDYLTQKIVSGDYDKAILSKTLVVGDAGADMLSAQAGGMDFLAVLTGISGKAAKPYFEAHGATYILDSICDMIIDD